MNYTNKNILNVAYGAVIAAMYVVLVLVFKPISFGDIQLRVAEVLCILPIFTGAAVPGIFVGCLLSNFISGAAFVDVIFGSIASLIGAYGTYLLRKNRKIAWLPPVISNTIIVPFILKYSYGIDNLIPIMMCTVGIGELISIGVFGNILRVALERYENVIFRKEISA